MPLNHIKAYTDASYSFEYKIAVAGYIIRINGQMILHEVHIIQNVRHSNDAEIHAVLLGLEHSFLQNDISKIQLYTDCESLVTLYRSNKLSQKKFLCGEIHETLKIIKDHGIKVSISHVEAHSDNYYNNKIDHSCRTHLRDFINKTYKKHESS